MKKKNDQYALMEGGVLYQTKQYISKSFLDLSSQNLFVVEPLRVKEERKQGGTGLHTSNSR
jgi:hypothetical protein